jgi:hypothetical protein
MATGFALVRKTAPKDSRLLIITIIRDACTVPDVVRAAPEHGLCGREIHSPRIDSGRHRKCSTFP